MAETRVLVYRFEKAARPLDDVEIAAVVEPWDEEDERVQAMGDRMDAEEVFGDDDDA